MRIVPDSIRGMPTVEAMKAPMHFCRPWANSFPTTNYCIFNGSTIYTYPVFMWNSVKINMVEVYLWSLHWYFRIVTGFNNNFYILSYNVTVAMNNNACVVSSLPRVDNLFWIHNNFWYFSSTYGFRMPSENGPVTYLGNFNNYVYNGIYALNKYFLCGGNGIIYTSSDGNNWVSENTGANGNLFAIAFGNNVVVAANDNGHFVYSSGNGTWNLANGANPGFAVRSIVYSQNLFVATGDMHLYNNITGVQTSPDGINWTKRNFNNMIWSNNIHSLQFLNNRFYAVGSDGTLQSSNDGITWVAHNFVMNNISVRDIILMDNNFIVACNDGTIWESTDLNNWTLYNFKFRFGIYEADPRNQYFPRKKIAEVGPYTFRYANRFEVNPKIRLRGEKMYWFSLLFNSPVTMPCFGGPHQMLGLRPYNFSNNHLHFQYLQCYRVEMYPFSSLPDVFPLGNMLPCTELDGIHGCPLIQYRIEY